MAARVAPDLAASVDDQLVRIVLHNLLGVVACDENSPGSVMTDAHEGVAIGQWIQDITVGA